MADTNTQELLQLSQQLLDSIADGDWDLYTRLCDDTLTAYEPEALGCRVTGMPFHKFYFHSESAGARSQTTMIDPHVRLMGDCAVVTYIRLIQRETASGFSSASFEETRVWQRQDGQWQHVHFHRSPPTKPGS